MCGVAYSMVGVVNITKVNITTDVVDHLMSVVLFFIDATVVKHKIKRKVK